jgi:hypothetical protein
MMSLRRIASLSLLVVGASAAVLVACSGDTTQHGTVPTDASTSNNPDTGGGNQDGSANNPDTGGNGNDAALTDHNSPTGDGALNQVDAADTPDGGTAVTPARSRAARPTRVPSRPTSAAPRSTAAGAARRRARRARRAPRRSRATRRRTAPTARSAAAPSPAPRSRPSARPPAGAPSASRIPSSAARTGSARTASRASSRRATGKPTRCAASSPPPSLPARRSDPRRESLTRRLPPCHDSRSTSHRED